MISEFPLLPQTIERLGLALMSFLLLLQLIRVRTGKEDDTWFILMIGTWTVSLFDIAYMTVVDPASAIASLLFPVVVVSFALMMGFFAQFIYVHQGNSFPKERVVAAVLSVAWVVWASFRVQDSARGLEGTEMTQDVNAVFGLAYFWIFMLVFRKRRHLNRTGQHERSSSLIPYLIVLGLLLAGTISFIPFVNEALSAVIKNVWMSFQLTAILLTLCIGKLHYSDSSTTLLVKLVGITMGFLLVVTSSFMQIAFPLGEDSPFKQDFMPESGNMGLLFTPLEEGGYEVLSDDSRLERPEAESLDTSDLSFISLPIGFEFPFFDRVVKTLYINPVGRVSFDCDCSEMTGFDMRIASNIFITLRQFSDERPKIAVMGYASIASEGRLFVGRTDSTITLTWDSFFRPIGSASIANPTSVQLRLHRSGTVQLLYENLTDVPPHRGLYLGGELGEASVNTELNFLEDTPFRTTPSQSVLETHRTLVDKDLHEAVVPFMWLFLASFVFVLVGFPVLFNRSILAPLHTLLLGVQKVNDGNLESSVEIGTNDEIGQLTGQFNEMTESLKGATQELENRVERRTAQLSKSLDDLHATQAQLVQQEKLASLGSLTAGIAHEIKNPLNFVNNFAEVSVEMMEELQEAVAAGNTDEAQSLITEMTENASQIAKHGKRADSIVRSMMQHARGGTSVHENVDVAAFLEENINLAWHGRRAKDQSFQADVIRDFAEDVGEARIQPMEMGRVVLNLLNNAFDAVAGGASGAVTVRAKRDKAGVTISVSDNGPGIPDEIREKIFEPFFTTKSTGEGTGLGLSMSHDIVTKGHGGSMKVGTGPAGGAEFSILLNVGTPV